MEVEVYYLPTEHGGRRGPCKTGYRPQFYYLGEDWDAVHEYPDVEWVHPGQSARAFLQFLLPHRHVGSLVPATPFLLREGQRVVGFGVVRAILDLEESARRVGSG